VLSDSGSVAGVRFGAMCDLVACCFPPEAVDGLIALSTKGAVATSTAASSRGGGDSDDEDEEGKASAVAVVSDAAVGVMVSPLLSAAWDEVLHKPILSHLGDTAERVREAAALLVGGFLRFEGAMVDLTETLPFLLPALLERCVVDAGAYDVQENVFVTDTEGEFVRVGACKCVVEPRVPLRA
jgi:hypothetical protein